MHRAAIRRAAVRRAAPLLAVALLVAACGDDDTAAPTTTAATSSTAAASTTAPTTSTAAPIATAATRPGGPTAYAGDGPYPVGVLEVDNSGSPMTVWYPAEPGSEAGRERAAYDMRDELPAGEQPAIADVAPSDTSFTTAAYEGLPAAAGPEPFPLVLFSHGAAGFRTQSTFLTTGLASWGFVVAAPQHPSRDLASVLGGTVGQGRSDVDDLRNALLVLEGETLDDDGPLSARIDTNRVVGVGHSAGGGAVYALAADGTVAAYVALASPAGPPEGGSAATVPGLFAAGTADAIAQIDRVRAAYEAAPTPKALAELDEATHLAFSDVCEIGVERGGVLQIAVEAGIAVPDVVLRLYGDSCEPQYTPSTEAWPAIRHLTVAYLRAALGIDAAPVGLDDSLAGAYTFPITWTEAG